jgi:antitoxin YefM
MISNISVSIDELRSNLADIVNRVTYAKDKVVVKKHNRDVALIISLDEYEKLMDPTKRLSRLEWGKHARRLDRLRGNIPSQDPSELDKIIGEEVKAVRAKKKSLR